MLLEANIYNLIDITRTAENLKENYPELKNSIVVKQIEMKILLIYHAYW